MWGWYTPTLFYATPPPLSLGQKLSGSLGHEKHPEIRSFKPAPQTGLRGYVE